MVSLSRCGRYVETSFAKTPKHEPRWCSCGTEAHFYAGKQQPNGSAGETVLIRELALCLSAARHQTEYRLLELVILCLSLVYE